MLANYEKVVPEELVDFFNVEGYFKFGVKCFKQAVALLKLVYSENYVTFSFPKVFVGHDNAFTIQIDDTGAYLARKKNSGRVTVSCSDNEMKSFATALGFSEPLGRDVQLKCINFIIHPRKVQLK